MDMGDAGCLIDTITNPRTRTNWRHELHHYQPLAQGFAQLEPSVHIQLHTTKANAISHFRLNGIPVTREPALVDQAPVPYRALSPRGPAAVVAEMRFFSISNH